MNKVLDTSGNNYLEDDNKVGDKDEKNKDKTLKAREFCEKVKKLAKEYELSFFIVTEGASAISNNGCEAVKNARDNHIKWELEHNLDPFEDWSKDNSSEPKERK